MTASDCHRTDYFKRFWRWPKLVEPTHDSQGAECIPTDIDILDNNSTHIGNPISVDDVEEGWAHMVSNNNEGEKGQIHAYGHGRTQVNTQEVTGNSHTEQSFYSERLSKSSTSSGVATATAEKSYTCYDDTNERGLYQKVWKWTRSRKIPNTSDRGADHRDEFETNVECDTSAGEVHARAEGCEGVCLQTSPESESGSGVPWANTNRKYPGKRQVHKSTPEYSSDHPQPVEHIPKRLRTHTSADVLKDPRSTLVACTQSSESADSTAEISTAGGTLDLVPNTTEQIYKSLVQPRNTAARNVTLNEGSLTVSHTNAPASALDKHPRSALTRKPTRANANEGLNTQPSTSTINDAVPDLTDEHTGQSESPSESSNPTAHMAATQTETLNRNKRNGDGSNTPDPGRHTGRMSSCTSQHDEAPSGDGDENRSSEDLKARVVSDFDAEIRSERDGGHESSRYSNNTNGICSDVEEVGSGLNIPTPRTDASKDKDTPQIDNLIDLCNSRSYGVKGKEKPGLESSADLPKLQHWSRQRLTCRRAAIKSVTRSGGFDTRNLLKREVFGRRACQTYRAYGLFHPPETTRARSGDRPRSRTQAPLLNQTANSVNPTTYPTAANEPLSQLLSPMRSPELSPISSGMDSPASSTGSSPLSSTSTVVASSPEIDLRIRLPSERVPDTDRDTSPSKAFYTRAKDNTVEPSKSRKKARFMTSVYLEDIVPVEYLTTCAFLGFSGSGRLVLSYSRQISELQEWEERYKYEVQLWRFNGTKTMRLIERITVFGGEYVAMSHIVIPVDEHSTSLTVYAMEKGQFLLATHIAMNDEEDKVLSVSDLCISGLHRGWALKTPGAIGTFHQGLYVNTESAFHILRWNYAKPTSQATSGNRKHHRGVSSHRELSGITDDTNQLAGDNTLGNRYTNEGLHTTGTALLRRVMRRVWKEFNAIERGDEFGWPETNPGRNAESSPDMSGDVSCVHYGTGSVKNCDDIRAINSQPSFLPLKCTPDPDAAAPGICDSQADHSEIRGTRAQLDTSGDEPVSATSNGLNICNLGDQSEAHINRSGGRAQTNTYTQTSTCSIAADFGTSFESTSEPSDARTNIEQGKRTVFTTRGTAHKPSYSATEKLQHQIYQTRTQAPELNEASPGLVHPNRLQEYNVDSGWDWVKGVTFHQTASHAQLHAYRLDVESLIQSCLSRKHVTVAPGGVECPDTEDIDTGSATGKHEGGNGTGTQCLGKGNTYEPCAQAQEKYDQMQSLEHTRGAGTSTKRSAAYTPEAVVDTLDSYAVKMEENTAKQATRASERYTDTNLGLDESIQAPSTIPGSAVTVHLDASRGEHMQKTHGLKEYARTEIKPGSGEERSRHICSNGNQRHDRKAESNTEDSSMGTSIHMKTFDLAVEGGSGEELTCTAVGPNCCADLGGDQGVMHRNVDGCRELRTSIPQSVRDKIWKASDSAATPAGTRKASTLNAADQCSCAREVNVNDKTAGISKTAGNIPQLRLCEGRGHEYFRFVRLDDYRVTNVCTSEVEVTLLIKAVVICDITRPAAQQIYQGNRGCPAEEPSHSIPRPLTGYRRKGKVKTRVQKRLQVGGKKGSFSAAWAQSSDITHNTAGMSSQKVNHNATGTQSCALRSRERESERAKCRVAMLVQTDPSTAEVRHMEVGPYTTLTRTKTAHSDSKNLPGRCFVGDPGAQWLSEDAESCVRELLEDGCSSCGPVRERWQLLANSTRQRQKEKLYGQLQMQPHVQDANGRGNLTRGDASAPITHRQSLFGLKRMAPQRYLHNSNVCALRESVTELYHPFFPIRIKLG